MMAVRMPVWATGFAAAAVRFSEAPARCRPRGSLRAAAPAARRRPEGPGRASEVVEKRQVPLLLGLQVDLRLGMAQHFGRRAPWRIQKSFTSSSTSAGQMAFQRHMLDERDLMRLFAARRSS